MFRLLMPPMCLYRFMVAFPVYNYLVGLVHPPMVVRKTLSATGTYDPLPRVVGCVR